MSPEDRKKAAQLLLQAEKERKPVVQLSTTWPDITIEDAYAIQSLVNDAKVAAGAKVRGHKVGLTSKAMQQSSQIDEPDYGVLMDNMFYDDGVKLPHANFCVPRVEMELGFVLGERLKGPGVGLLDVMRATEWVVPSIEVIDARVQNPRKIFDTVSDNGAAAAVVIGGRPVRPSDVDLRWVAGLMYRNETIEESGVAAAVLGHPALGIAWLANKVGRFGATLEPGHFTLSGSFIRPVWANKGDVLRADFGSLGSVAVQFV
jgi:2-oxo-hept-3-ene-1,7-dioate hydratase